MSNERDRLELQVELAEVAMEWVDKMDTNYIGLRELKELMRRNATHFVLDGQGLYVGGTIQIKHYSELNDGREIHHAVTIEVDSTRGLITAWGLYDHRKEYVSVTTPMTERSVEWMSDNMQSAWFDVKPSIV